MRFAAEACRNLKEDNAVADTLATLLSRVELRQEGMRLTLSLASLLPMEAKAHGAITLTHSISMQMKRRGVEMRQVVGNTEARKPDLMLIKAISRARIWFDELASGKAKKLNDIAMRNNVSERYVGILLPLASLAPVIIEDIIAGVQPADLMAESIIKRTHLPIEWAEQQSLLGFN